MEASMTRKIKAAIKAKLIELEAYVDDELPDYIMVMVANKKTKEQMSTDLSLFLGDDALKFATWLHRVLDKIQIAQKERAEEEAAKPKVEIPDVIEIPPPTISVLLGPKTGSRGAESPLNEPPKKMTINFKKNSKVGDFQKSKRDAASAAASPRPDVASPVGSPRGASPGMSPSHQLTSPQMSRLAASPGQGVARSPTPEVPSEQETPSEDRKRKSAGKSAGGKKDESKRKREEPKLSRPSPKSKANGGTKSNGGTEETKNSKSADVEEKERNIIKIMEQIRSLKEKLLSRDEETGSDDEEDDDVGDLIRDKITHLRGRLESIQESLADDDDDEDEDEKGTENILDDGSASAQETPAPESQAPASKAKASASKTESPASKIKAPSKIEKPASKTESPASISETPRAAGSPTAHETPDDAFDDLHLPVFLLQEDQRSSDSSKCAACGAGDVVVFCSGCRAFLHCQSDKNCFRKWHKDGNVDVQDPSLRMKETPAAFR